MTDDPQDQPESGQRSDAWCDALDRLEELGTLSLKALRKIADGEPYWSRGKCLAEILDTEFGQSVKTEEDRD